MTERTGKCLCGAVAFDIEAESAAIGVCHCDMCRRWASGPYMGLHLKGDVAFKGEDAIGVYRGSAWAERGFCKSCGSALFWRMQDRSEIVVSAGLFEDQADFQLGRQVCIDEKPAFYAFAQQTPTMTGAEIEAMYGVGGDEKGEQ